MKKVIEELKEWGCDTRGALERMIDDEEFYIHCLEQVSREPLFEELQEALSNGDVKRGFEVSHTLKGVLGNVGLTPMYDNVVEIVEPLRAGNGTNLMDKCELLMQQKEHLVHILQQAQA